MAREKGDITKPEEQKKQKLTLFWSQLQTSFHEWNLQYLSILDKNFIKCNYNSIVIYKKINNSLIISNTQSMLNYQLYPKCLFLTAKNHYLLYIKLNKHIKKYKLQL